MFLNLVLKKLVQKQDSSQGPSTRSLKPKTLVTGQRFQRENKGLYFEKLVSFPISAYVTAGTYLRLLDRGD